MAFSVYSSLKNIPREMLEAAQLYRLSWWQRLMQLELPYAAIGLIWNSMMSVAGGWFFLMACEMFVLGNRDLRLPGLGSYLQTASNAGDTRCHPLGVDRDDRGDRADRPDCSGVPIIAWSEKFKFEQVEAAETPRSPVLNFLRRSRLLSAGRARLGRAGARSSDAVFCARQCTPHGHGRESKLTMWTSRVLAALARCRHPLRNRNGWA